MFSTNMRPDVRLWKGQFVKFAQEKKDGHRLTIVRTLNKIRALTKTPGQDHWEYLQENQDLRRKVEALDTDTVLDGEIYCPGVRASSVPTLLREDVNKLHFSVFAVPFFDGQDLRMQDRIFNSILIDRGFEYPRTYDVMGPMQGQDIEDLMRTHPQWEGLVLKVGNYFGWYKLKKSHTIDVVITDWKEGKNRLVGMMGSVEVSVFDSNGISVKCGTVGGFSDEDRARLTAKDVLYRVIEVEFDEITTHGQLKFARFVRWRDDKPADQCTMDQILDLQL